MHCQASGRAAGMEAELQQLRARRDALEAEASAMRARHSFLMSGCLLEEVAGYFLHAER